MKQHWKGLWKAYITYSPYIRYLITVNDLLQVPLNGHWGRWAAWSACSTTCGKGYQTRSRMCDDPPPEFKGDICEGALVEVQMCKGDRPKCKSSNKGTSKLSLLLGFCYKSAVFPQNMAIVGGRQHSCNRELMPRESKANDQNWQEFFKILLKE